MSTLPASFPVFWMDVYPHGIEGVVEIQSSDLPSVVARVSDIISVLNDKIPSLAGSEDASREVVFIQFYGISVENSRPIETVIPVLFGGFPRLLAMTRTPPTLSHLASPTARCVYVRTLTGKAIEVRGRGSHTIGDIKGFIHDQEGIPPDQQRLLFEGVQLDDGRTLLDDDTQHQCWC